MCNKTKLNTPVPDNWRISQIDYGKNMIKRRRQKKYFLRFLGLFFNTGRFSHEKNKQNKNILFFDKKLKTEASFSPHFLH